MAFKNPNQVADAMLKVEEQANPQVENVNTTPVNKYNLKPTNEIRPYHAGSLSQEIGSTYDNLSDFYGVDLNDLVHGEKGFMKTKYPKGLPDFAGDIIYSQKYWNELEDWAKKDKGIDFTDRSWERYKLDPDYFEGNVLLDEVKNIRNYGKKVEPKHEIHNRPLKDFQF